MDNLFIVELTSPFERLEIQYVPSEFSQPREADLSAIDVVGRNNPTKQWTGGNTSLSLQLDFYATDEAREEVMRKVRWLQSLTYKSRDGIVPVVKLVFGSTFRDEEWNVKSVNPKFSNFHPAYNWLPCQAYVDIQFSLANTEDFNLETIRNY